jgi:hypothetical protein
MRKFTGSAGRVLGAGILVLAGTAVLMLGGGGVASARPVSANTNACNKIFAIFAELAKSSGSLKSEVATAAAQFTQAAAGASPTIRGGVALLVADLRADAASGHVNRPQLVADGDAINAACAAAPKGAPATGGGSTAGVQDPALFGLGGAIVLAGAGVLFLGLARRNRPRGSPGPG